MWHCETVSGILTPWSLLLLVSRLPTEKCINKICARWMLCFACCCLPLLGHLVTWIGRSRGRKSFIIGTKFFISTSRHGSKTWSAFPENARRVGRPDSMVQQFCILHCDRIPFSQFPLFFSSLTTRVVSGCALAWLSYRSFHIANQSSTPNCNN